MNTITWRRRLFACVSATAIGMNACAAGALAAPPMGAQDGQTTTPIKHVIVIYGENRSFDHLFATFRPGKGQSVHNLLSEGIIDEFGNPGPNAKKATQYQATDTTTYSIAPTKAGAYEVLPPAMTGGAPSFASDTSPPPFATASAAAAADYGLLPIDIPLLTTGATGLPQNSVDTRRPDASTLAPYPYQLTPGIAYDDYASSPVHRFYQNWQQSDCAVSHATSDNPSGCLMDLFPWVETTIGAGSNGAPQPANFNDQSTGEGSTAMGFYNVLQGDMPYFTQLAYQYAMSDNYHQPTMGGTGLDSIFAGFADALWYTKNSQPATPPSNQIENPDPQSRTNNYYTQDGYSGGSYSACADTSQHGVGAVVSYLQALPHQIAANCESGHYYLLNNYNPGYFGDGSVDTTDTFAIPPVTTRSIGDVLQAANISVTWFGEGWDQYVKNPNDPTNVYCNICNPFQYETSIMANPSLRTSMIQDTKNFYTDLQQGSLPAVSLVKPSGLNDGHPASSKYDIFEAFVQKIVTMVQAQPELWQSTAIFITTDEAGGYYDSGYIQPLDFFGDGPRISLLAVSPYSQGGRVVHSYTDHVSILKFIEHNWSVGPISSRSRDNLPNPISRRSNPYVPTNSPAIGDLMDMFDFGKINNNGSGQQSGG
jgi:phospholipase C